MSTPWLSVIVPTYNGKAYLAQALESICTQVDAGLEVVAVDDGSTDRTLDVLASFGGRLPLSIKALPHTGNWTAGVNRALEAARGEYASVLPQDDLWLPGRSRAMRALAERFPGAGLLISAAIYIDAAGDRVGRWRCPLPARRELAGEHVRERLIVQNFMALPAACFRRADALAARAFDEDLWYTADWDLWLTLASAGPVVHEPAPLAAFRLHGQSQTMQRAGQSDELRRQMVAVYARHLPGGRLPRRWAGVAKAARFSIDVNTTLARRAAGGRGSLMPLVGRFLGLGPWASYKYVRDSRIVERVLARRWAALGAGPPAQARSAG